MASATPAAASLSDWPGESPPRTVVVLTRDGGLARLPYGEAYRRTTTPASADDVWTVGACR